MATIPFYAKLTIPAGTTTLQPVSVRLEVPPGRVKILRLFIPPGPRGEIKLWFKHQQTHLAPVPPGSWDALNNITLEFPLDFKVLAGEGEFYLFGASPNANFQHVVDFELLVDTARPTTTAAGSQSVIKRISNLFGN